MEMSLKASGLLLEDGFNKTNSKFMFKYMCLQFRDQTLFPTNQFPTKEDLDGAFPDIPLWLTRIDGHSGWANSAALRIVGPLPSTDPPGF